MYEELSAYINDNEAVIIGDFNYHKIDWHSHHSDKERESH